MGIQQILIASLWIFGFWNAFREDNIFEPIGKWWERTVPEWIYKPTIGCPLCMASVHGTAWFLIFNGTINLWWFPFIVCVSGLNVVIMNLWPPEDD